MNRRLMLRNVWVACSTLALAHKRITIRKVAQMVGLKHYSVAYHHMGTLVLAGYLAKERGEHTSRADWVVNIPLIVMGGNEVTPNAGAITAYRMGKETA